MTNIKKFSVGASSNILANLGGHTDKGFSKYSEAGIPYAELSLGHDELCICGFYENPQKISALAAKYGVHFGSFHVPFSDIINPANLISDQNKTAMEIMEKSILAALKIGIETIVIHPSGGTIDDDTRWERLERSAENLAQLSKLCKENGAVLALENLPGNCLGNSSFEIVSFLNYIPDIALCFDTNHLTMQTNEDFLDDLAEQGMHGRIHAIHASDYDFLEERHNLPGDGINDWSTIISKLNALGYSGIFMYQTAKNPVTLLDIKDNYENVILPLL